ncbi:MAG: hypothetical protein AAGA83_03965 [Cyanobacteria bacterium P01_F01_bin.116]
MPSPIIGAKGRKALLFNGLNPSWFDITMANTTNCFAGARDRIHQAIANPWRFSRRYPDDRLVSCVRGSAAVGSEGVAL